MHPSIHSGARRATSWALALSLLLVGTSAALAGDEEEARLHFEKAQTAYKLGQFLEAIREYEAAYRAMSDAAFLFNIAQAQRQQYRQDRQVSRLHRALSLYKSYLRELPQAPNRETVQKIVEELHSLIQAVEDRASQMDNEKKDGRLVLRGERAEGGQVTLDGQLIGTVPLAYKVEPGAHLIKVTKAGYKPWSTSVTVSAGAKLDLPVTLEAVGGGAEDAPVYKKWWFWTIIGVAVVGGTGAGVGIYYGTRGDDIPEMPEIDLR